MTYAEAVNSLEAYLQNIDSTISFETWMNKVEEQLSLIYGRGSVQQRNFLSLKSDFDTSKTGLTDPVKYRINEKNFRLRAKSHLASLVIGLQESEQQAIREAQRKKKEAEEKRIKQLREAEERRLEQEQENQRLRDQLMAASQHRVEDIPKKPSRVSKVLPWLVAPIVAAALFYGGYALADARNEKEKQRLINENHTLLQNNFQLTDSLHRQKQIVNQPVDSTLAKWIRTAFKVQTTIWSKSFYNWEVFKTFRSLSAGYMIQQILFFPDAINFQAFILLEKIPPQGVNKEKSFLQLPLSENQVEKACKLYGAVIRKNWKT